MTTHGGDRGSERPCRDTRNPGSRSPGARSLDDLLAGAVVPAGVHDPETVAAARRRVEREVAESLWREALHRDSYAHLVLSESPRVRPGGPTPPAGDPADEPAVRLPVALLRQAARDLSALCELVVRDSRAARDIAGLVNSRRIEPDGALVFACLLHLAGRVDGAQFWWQFGAGAGKSTPALCLYLLHLQRGEMRDAEHWACQAAELEVLEAREAPAPVAGRCPSAGTGTGAAAGASRAGEPVRRGVGRPRGRTFYAREPCHRPLYERGFATVESMLLRTRAGLHTRGAAPDAVGGAAGARPAVAAAIEGLTGVHERYDRDFGHVPRPDPGLARRLAVDSPSPAGC
ncbi:hypothetical protein GCM10027160_04220 [Streptomyces calidiresistens]|uniref:Uncharacterized protein n=1 Tax=Streptomyces calidiresistens TaxID=1485586 RepID=A0A7W3T4H4_9ACTN|nr:hypothetical protein [Streptomyces calidiresistens]MBB0230805.1 hypothetical protein [Streptomyces calidiresistens]